jgi:hypothetical protein
MSFQTTTGRLEQRREIYEKYTLHHYLALGIGSLDDPRRVRKPPQELEFHKRVAPLLQKLDDTIILHRPELSYRTVRKDLKAASARVQKIRSGISMARVLDAEIPEYPLQEAKKFTIMEEKDIRRISRREPAPIIYSNACYVVPSEIFKDSPVLDTQNQFNRFRNYIYEGDRYHQNQLIQELNKRNRRRRHALPKQYEDMTKYGLTESHRRARRAERLSSLAEGRKEEWWKDLVASVPKEGRNKMDLVYLETLTTAKEFNEATFKEMYHYVLSRNKNDKRFREILVDINERGGYMEPFRLNMILRDEESE